MTEITNPLPEDPAGASTVDESSTPPDGSRQLLDAGTTGTDEGPAGIPASLAGVDKDGDEVPPPPAALPGDAGRSSGPAEDSDALSPADAASPQSVSAGRGESAAAGQLPSEREGR